MTGLSACGLYRRGRRPRAAGGGVFLVLLLLAPAAAQDFQVGARAKGMGGSYTAFGDDPVSIWANPAGPAAQPTQLALTYQSFTQYEFGEVGMQVSPAVVGEPESGLLDPPISPAFFGLVAQVGTDGLDVAVSVAYVRPFQIKYVYYFDDPGLGDLLTQTDQQFSRIRAGIAAGKALSKESPLLTRISAGIAVDYVYSSYAEVDQSPDPASESLIYKDSASAPGFGAGLLATLYETDALMADLGVAYNSAANFDFALDNAVFPVWDWPALASAGLAFYLGEGYPLRLTFDVQWIGWRAAVGRPEPGMKRFEDTVSYSLGAEYRFRLDAATHWLFTRMGLKSLDTPWQDEGRLPAVGLSELRIDTHGDRMLILSLGAGLYWAHANAAGDTRLSGIDLAVELFGDAPFLIGVSYTHQFD